MSTCSEIVRRYISQDTNATTGSPQVTGDAIEEFATQFDKSALEMQLFEMESALINNTESKSEAIQSLFRDVHSLKGTSAFLKLDPLTQFLHKIEDVIGVISNNALRITSVKRTEIFDYFLQSFDLLEKLITTYQQESNFVLKDDSVIFGFYIRLINEFRNILVNTEQYLEISALDESMF